MTYEELQDKVNKILTEAETAMENEIEKFNETNDEDLEVNTTDLGYKFTELKDYVEDYTQYGKTTIYITNKRND